MALVVKSLDSSIQLKFKIGEDGEGKDITRSRTFNRINSTISDEDLYEVVLVLESLQEHERVATVRNSPVAYGESEA